MRITHITNTLRIDGTGITNVVVDLVTASADAGHDVQVLCNVSDEGTIELLRLHRVRVHEGFDASSALSAVQAARRTRRFLRGTDIVHVHTVRATLLALAAGPLRFFRRSISTLHNPYQRSVPVMWTTRAVVSISHADADHVRSRSHGVRTPSVVLNGLLGTPRLSTAEAVEGVPLVGRAVVYVGALYARKGVDVLLRAMPGVLARVPDAHLYLVGNRDNAEMEQIAHGLGLDAAVTFVGFHPDPRQYMKAAEVFVLPSRAEGFGNVLTEARSMQVPIVASRVGGIPEALDGGDAGVLVDPEDAGQLEEAIVGILTDPLRADELRRRAGAHLEVFSVTTAARRYHELYLRLLGTPG